MGKRVLFHLLFPLVLVLMTLSGCSKNEEPAKASEKATTSQAAEAIKEYGQKPMDKARAAQRMGDERTTAIDEATKKQ